MRTVITETTVYSYSELSDAAKEKAREAYGQFQWENGSMAESMELIANGILEDEGFTDATDLTYSLYQQGGEPVFGTNGILDHEREALFVTVGTRHFGGGSFGFDLDVEHYDGENATIDEYTFVQGKLLALSSAILKAFYTEDEYQFSDENVAETSEANGWEYDENGKLV